MFDEKKYKTKAYVHFDHRVNINTVKSYVTDREKISVHSFLPLIQYNSSFDKFNQTNYLNKEPDFLDTKIRDIKYAGHLDNHIYKYYSEMIQNDFYNKWCVENGLDNCILAYRNNKKGKSNINFAAEVISNIVNMDEAYILVGDFTTYFDNINHSQLKKYIQELLEVERLPTDWFNIFQSVTKFGYFQKDLLDGIFGSTKDLKRKGQNSYFTQLSEFRKFKKQNKEKLHSNKTGISIPQGTAISATFANIYALNFDRDVNEIASLYKGIYRRYSDDFILIFPKKSFQNIEDFFRVENKIRTIANEEKIEIQERKTCKFEYSNETMYNLDESKKDHLDYLGFIFDGRSVQLRGKGTYKFYRKAKKLILKAKRTKEKKNLEALPYKKAIYQLYTDLGIGDGHGNYISYAIRSQKIFDEISPKTKNLMMNQLKNRKKFIEKKLGVRLNFKVYK